MPDLEIMWTKVDEAPALATFSLLPIVQAFVGVILRQLDTKPPSLDPDRRVALRIEPGRTAEYLGRNLILLQCEPRVVEGVLRKITQQFAQRFRAAQTMTINKLIYLLEALFPARSESAR